MRRLSAEIVVTEYQAQPNPAARPFIRSLQISRYKPAPWMSAWAEHLGIGMTSNKSSVVGPAKFSLLDARRRSGHFVGAGRLGAGSVSGAQAADATGH